MNDKQLEDTVHKATAGGIVLGAMMAWDMLAPGYIATINVPRISWDRRMVERTVTRMDWVLLSAVVDGEFVQLRVRPPKTVSVAEQEAFSVDLGKIAAPVVESRACTAAKYAVQAP